MSSVMVNRETSSPWQPYPLGEIADIQPGQRSITPASMAQAHGTVPLIFPDDLKNGKEEVTGSIYTTWECLGEKEMQNQVLTQERLLLTVSGRKIGTVCITRGVAIHPHTIVAIIPKSPQRVDIEFLFYSLRYQYSVLKREVQGSVLTSIDIRSLTQLPIPVPLMQTQKQIVKQLDTHLRTVQYLYTLVEETQRGTDRLSYEIQSSIQPLPDLRSRQQIQRFASAQAIIRAMHMQASQSTSYVAQVEQGLLEQAFQRAML